MSGPALCLREHPPSFGPYLRRLRRERRMSLRDAAGQLGVTFTKLQKMETGGRFRLPTLDLLFALADCYGRPRPEVLAEAGIHLVEADDLARRADVDRAFADLVLHPDLRPARMTVSWTDAFSPLQKAQWIEFARRLAGHPDPAALVERILERPPSPAAAAGA